MIDWLIWIVFAFLLIASVIDWKLKAMPSIILTAMLFAVAFLNPANLWFGIMGFIVAYLLYEAGFYSGVADIKVFSMLAFMLASTNWFFALMLLTVVYGFVWKVMIKSRLKKEQNVAFIPVFFFVYITLYILGGLSV